MQGKLKLGRRRRRAEVEMNKGGIRGAKSVESEEDESRSVLFADTDKSAASLRGMKGGEQEMKRIWSCC